eukprot:TRINITY_DN14085_c0_g1_i1.p2 TRINITY_DN14085_c0_g1~~TRINITY_DN14085_c0_g1_i1.p2  ORF type:complete len:284 (-),score=41.04 TRINITY_DN14085_c0_g1_i1:191-1042(-)
MSSQGPAATCKAEKAKAKNTKDATVLPVKPGISDVINFRRNLQVAAGPCDDMVVNGQHYSLTTLANSGPFSVVVTGGDQQPHTYDFAVCGGLPDPCPHQGGGTSQQCNTVGSAGMCESWPGNGRACGGRWTGAITLAAVNEGNATGVSFLYSDGDDCPCTPPNRRTTIKIICDPTVTGAPAGITGNIPDPNNLMYMITMRHANGCPSSAGATTLSAGSILLIILVVTFSIYFFGGILFNKYKLNMTGVDVIPNKDFWVDLPALVKDGGNFIITCGRGGSYEKV